MASTREEYDKAVQYCREHGYWACHTALIEDGFDPNVNYRRLYEKSDSAEAGRG